MKNESESKLKQTLDTFEAGFGGLRESARLVLAVAATTRLKRKHPLAVILVGGPSSGKTTLLMPFTKGQDGSKLKTETLRVDDFSAASLVSHAANKTEEQLAKIDLLPKLKNRCVIVKEMAPVFTGNEEELLRKFGIFASILDGEGYTSSKGTHGQRGYTDPILFSLLGAVTPNVLSRKVTKSLDAVGPRFCFWFIPDRQINATTWRGSNTKSSEKQVKAEAALISFAEHLFESHAPGSVVLDEFKMSEEMHAKLSLIAVTMAMLRTRGIEEVDDEGNRLGVELTHESPERAYRYLEQIVFGSALADDRREVENQDLQLALKTAISSASSSRRKTLMALIEAGGKRTNRELCIAMKVDDDTAAKYAKFMEASGFLERANFDGTTQWDLTEAYRPLRTIYDPTLVSEEEIRRVREEMDEDPESELPF